MPSRRSLAFPWPVGTCIFCAHSGWPYLEGTAECNGDVWLGPIRRYLDRTLFISLLASYYPLL